MFRWILVGSVPTTNAIKICPQVLFSFWSYSKIFGSYFFHVLSIHLTLFSCRCSCRVMSDRIFNLQIFPNFVYKPQFCSMFWWIVVGSVPTTNPIKICPQVLFSFWSYWPWHFSNFSSIYFLKLSVQIFPKNLDQHFMGRLGERSNKFFNGCGRWGW